MKSILKSADSYKYKKQTAAEHLEDYKITCYKQAEDLFQSFLL